MWSSVNLCDLIDKLESVFSVFRRGNERVIALLELRSKHKSLHTHKREQQGQDMHNLKFIAHSSWQETLH